MHDHSDHIHEPHRMPLVHKTKEKFIQAVMSAPGYRKGAMTKKAAKEGMKPLEFARHVLAHPEHHDLRTRREAQFLVNIQRH